MKPKIVCLCGSTRFAEWFMIKRWELEKQGIITLGINILPNNYFAEGNSHGAEQEGVKEILDELHKRKIDLSDEVFILNVDGYIGEAECAFNSKIQIEGSKGFEHWWNEELIMNSWLRGIASNPNEEDHWAGSPETNPALNPAPKAVQQAAKEYATKITKPDDLLLDEQVYTPAVVYMAAEMGFLAGASFNSDAVEFALWINREIGDMENTQYNYKGKFLTTQELYNLFLVDKNKNNE